MRLELDGRVVLVTGAARGIGRAAAEALAESGATVAVHCRNERREVSEMARTLGRGARVFPADFSRRGAATTLFGKVIAHYGHLDVLINNAGVAIESPTELPDSEWLDNWEKTLRVNLTATAELCRAAVPHFRDQGGGRMINVASRAAFRGDMAEYLAYAASKGGVVALTRSLARGYGKDNIKAFVVAPGFVRTDMSKTFFDRYGEASALDDIALPHLTEPKDLAPLIVFLSSGGADHATGGTFDMNAGSYMR